MHFKQRSELQGKHALLNPSSYHWLNYDDQKLRARYISALQSQRGVDLHLLAHEAIRLRVRLHKVNASLAQYVEDGIKYDMSVEAPLWYSPHCFGTPDTISFRRNQLRIHDLKTGIITASMKQLEVYAALFCLDYGVSPYEITTELRIYQGDEIRVLKPTGEDISIIMDKIIYSSKMLDAMESEFE